MSSKNTIWFPSRVIENSPTPPSIPSGCEEQNNVVSLSNEVDIVWCLVKTQSMNDDFELDDGQWVGSLSSFNPGAGYWFNSSSEMCFNYTCAE